MPHAPLLNPRSSEIGCCADRECLFLRRRFQRRNGLARSRSAEPRSTPFVRTAWEGRGELSFARSATLATARSRTYSRFCEQAGADRRVEVTIRERQAKAIEDALPSAQIVKLPRANHYVFLSNEADVLREMRAFLGRLR